MVRCRALELPLGFNNHFQHHEQTIALTVICFSGLRDQKNKETRWYPWGIQPLVSTY